MNTEENRRHFLRHTLLLGGAAVPLAALASDVAADETAEKPVPRRGRITVLASEAGAKLDSNVETGGGTDDTDALQAILDSAPNVGSLHLILDGAALVRGLKIHSNTTIECPTKACGLFLKGQTNAPLLRNARPSSHGERLDKNITLLGGTYNNNCPEQAHDYARAEAGRPVEEIPDVFEERMWNFTFEFFGVEHFTARGVTIRDQRTFALLMGNFYRVVFEDIDIDLPHKVDAQNQDGLHFWGPGRFLTLKNIQGDAGDDFIALAPDENDKESDITDVLIDGVFLKEADQGIRLLSRHKGRLDRVVIRNVTGTYRSFGFFIEPWFNSNGGNYGSIVFDTIDLRGAEPNYHYYPPFLFNIGGTVESLVFKNIYHHAPADERTLFNFGASSCMKGPGDDGSIPSMNIRSVLIDGLRVYEPKTPDAATPLIRVFGPVGRLDVRDVEIIRDENAPAAGTLLEVSEGAAVGRLSLENITAERMAHLVRVTGGEVKNLSLGRTVLENCGEPVSDEKQ